MPWRIQNTGGEHQEQANTMEQTMRNRANRTYKSVNRKNLKWTTFLALLGITNATHKRKEYKLSGLGPFFDPIIDERPVE